MLERQSVKSSATRYRHQVTIERNGTTTDGEGGQSENWQATGGPVWCQVSPIQARQRFAYRGEDVEATHLIRMHGSTDIEEADRINFEERIFTVLTVENIQEIGLEKVVTCVEVRRV